MAKISLHSDGIVSSSIEMLELLLPPCFLLLLGIGYFEMQFSRSKYSVVDIVRRESIPPTANNRLLLTVHPWHFRGYQKDIKLKIT